MVSKPLLQRNTRTLLVWLPVVLLVCSLLFYKVLVMHAHHMQEQQLRLKQENVWNAFIAKSGKIERHIPGEYDIAEKTLHAPAKLDEVQDTLVYYAGKKGVLPFEMITGRFHWNDKPYYLTTYVSSTETSHLIAKVFITEAVILLLLLVTIAVLNRKSSGLLWRPFFATVEAVNDYDVTRNRPLELPVRTGITEFDGLNNVLTELINKVNATYSQQKQFVENASHEMQTPLAIIRSKVELLINQPDLTEREALLLGDITEANNRLSLMNRTLLLLAKIENNQFPDVEEVDISGMLRQTLDNFRGHYDDFPKLISDIQHNVVVRANRPLMEILVSNLINNAIVHNKPNGVINIVLDNSRLRLENTGEPPEMAPEELFGRFKKGSDRKRSTGLGLALVKQICELYHYAITYEYHDGWHRVVVSFR